MIECNFALCNNKHTLLSNFMKDENMEADELFDLITIS